MKKIPKYLEGMKTPKGVMHPKVRVSDSPWLKCGGGQGALKQKISKKLRFEGSKSPGGSFTPKRGHSPPVKCRHGGSIMVKIPPKSPKSRI